MKYLKTYEAVSKPVNDEVMSDIRDYVTALTYDEDLYSNPLYDDIDDCPFAEEMAILHQQDYIDEIFDDFVSDYGSEEKYIVTLSEFRKIYKELLIKARKKIIDDLLENPSLYAKWEPDYSDLDIPEYIKNACKYNL